MPFYSLSSSGGLVEAATFAALPATGATGTLYVVTGTNTLYRWSGSAYVEVSASPAEVVEAANLAAFPATGAAGKIYVALDTGKTYRWGGSAYAEISAGDWATLTNKPSTFAPSAHTHVADDVFVYEGSFNIEGQQNTSVGQSFENVAGALTGKAPLSHTHAASAINSGTIATARLGSGTASASTFLRGDQTYAAPPVTSVDGYVGAVTITKCTVYTFTRSSGPSGASGPTSTSIGDKTWQWAIPTNAKIIEILQVGAGAGGGSGRRGASATLRGGGGGGCGGQIRCSKFFYADRASNDLHIAIGSGGAGGASASTDDASGNAGSSGGFTRVFWGSSASSTVLDYNGGVWDSTHAVLQNLTPISNGGTGGTSTAGGTGGSPSLQLQPAFSNASGSSFGGAGGNGTTAAGVGFGDNFATCGGGGGGISSGNVAQAGADSTVPNHYGTTSLNSSGGAVGGGTGTARLAYPSMAYALGCGGPGGGANASGAGGDGAAGSFPGGGGGGGGASVNGSASGKGGNGGDGICYVIVWS